MMSKLKIIFFSMIIVVLTACSAQETKQAVQVSVPTSQNNGSNNQSSSTQNNTGSGTQVNNSGSGTSNTNTGSGNQTTNTNSGSGTQTNTTVNNSNTGSGTLIQPINTGAGEQNTTIVTGTQNNNNVAGNQTVVNGTQNNTQNTTTVSGNQTVVNGNQTNTTTTNTTVNITINPPADVKVSALDITNWATGVSVKWLASENANKYTVYSNGTAIAETTDTKLDMPPDKVPANFTLQNITVVASNNTQISTPAAVATPLPNATSDISVVEFTTVNGKIMGDNGIPLSGVRVQFKSLNASVPYATETLTSADGSYQLKLAPAGVQVEIIASKVGFTTRKRVEVFKSNKQGDPNANRYDFGNDGSNTQFSSSYAALSDKPEVVMVSPGRNSSGIDPKPNPGFFLKFSEPMDRTSVENTFSIRTFNSRKLSVDAGNSLNINTVLGNGQIATNFVGANSSKIWNKDAFNISWNSDDTEVTFSFNAEKQLPTDKDSNLVPDYNVAFNSFNSSDRLLKDKSGISRSEKHFKLTDGDFEESYKFSIRTDEVKPTVSSLTAETNENGSQNGDAIRVRYSERMIIYTRDITIAGGMENAAGSAAKAPAGYPGGSVATSSATACNYQVRVVRAGTEILNTSWCNLPGGLNGSAVYDTTDLTHKTVLLLPPFGTDIYKPGDTVQVTIASTIMDPAGNTLDGAGNNASANAS